MIFKPIDQKLIIFVEELKLITFDMVIFPAIQHAYLPRLLANELVSVQPLGAPSGILYYFTPRVSGGYFNTTFTVSSRAKGTEVNGIIFYPIDKWSFKV